MRDPHFFQNCGSFQYNISWLCFDFSEKYHNFERNEDRATVFLKWTDFSHFILKFIFWEDRKNMAHPSLFIWHFSVFTSNLRWKVGQIFVAFADYRNFKKMLVWSELNHSGEWRNIWFENPAFFICLHVKFRFRAFLKSRESALLIIDINNSNLFYDSEAVNRFPDSINRP